jgi:hypothetical protein
VRRNHRRRARHPCEQHPRRRAVVRGTGAREWLVLDYFLGTVWHADTGDVLDAVQALIEQGNVGPVTMREIAWALWDVTPFYCPECRLNYCSLDWNMHFSVRAGTCDCIIGSCPNGHRHLLG